MPAKWAPTQRHASTLGRLRVVAHVPGQPDKDITYLRNVPIQVDSYSTADPFGYATAVLTFPQITAADEIGHGEFWWLQDYLDITIYLNDGTNDTATLWEGFIVSLDWQMDENNSQLQAQCKGAVFQVDNYVEKPFFPPRPWAYENLISRCFDHHNRPDLRVAPLKIEWPSGWTKKALDPSAYTYDYYRPYGVKPGQNVTGYYGRVTGGWDKSLTSYIQGLLQVMLDDKGQQWTIRCDPGRKPVLYVREMFNQTPTWSVFVGQPGASIQITRDLTQFANVIYGSGTDAAGTEWSRQNVSSDGSMTTYEPLAWDDEVWPHDSHNPRLNLNKMTVEANVKFDNGFNERQAVDAARTMLKRDMDPGLTGTLTLKVDLPEGSRYLIKAGDTILVRYLAGSGHEGVLFHIAQVDVSIADGTVTLKIDTKFRDLLTIEEVLVRTRDPLTPVSLLQVGKRSLLIQDQLAPWDYSRGAGFLPGASINFFHHKPAASTFPYTDWTTKHPPKKYPHFYIECHANAHTRTRRWATGFMIRLSEKGDIRLTQVAAYDRNGNLVKVPFHFSVYYTDVTAEDMPYDANGPSPFIPNAFQSTTQYGLDVPAGTPGWTLFSQQSMIMGWGNGPQPAGYSPGMKSRGDKATGLLIDESVWSYDMTNNPDFDKNPKKGYREPTVSYSAYGVFYAEYHEPIYFLGRFFRKEPGV